MMSLFSGCCRLCELCGVKEGCICVAHLFDVLLLGDREGVYAMLYMRYLIMFIYGCMQ